MNLFSKFSGLAATSLFVILWSSGAIFSRYGLDHASPFAFLTLRFCVALIVLMAIGGIARGVFSDWRSLPRTAFTGLILIGGYSILYLLTLDHGITPGLLATILGLQPVLTLFVTEGLTSRRRLLGLGVALAGLIAVVFDSLVVSKFSGMGIATALGALACMTAGTILQKKSGTDPLRVLPVHYAASLLLYLFFVPFKPFDFEYSIDFLIPLLWLGIVISVVAQTLFYRLIRAGNLVNVTSLFYLVPAGTAILDYLVYGHALSHGALIGMAGILAGLMLVSRK